MSTDANRVERTPAPVADDSETVVDLQDEVEQLKQAVWSHATVDQAIGVVIALGQLSPDDAWDVLREVSMRTNTKLRDVSQQIVTWGRTGQLADELRRELERQLGQQQSNGTPADGE
ncbi:ANTAR domain-containing protein [Streptomyces sp. NPDC051214]|uniref:ANTAR domain-containing protein n=1 Tax=Streptomyces sp. NPDC051214 TaxID=3155282 RepID=UPI0034340563